MGEVEQVRWFGARVLRLLLCVNMRTLRVLTSAPALSSVLVPKTSAALAHKCSMV